MQDPWCVPVCSHPALLQDSFYRNKEKKLQFMRAMHGLINVAARQAATAFDLSRFSSACDLGGEDSPPGIGATSPVHFFCWIKSLGLHLLTRLKTGLSV